MTTYSHKKPVRAVMMAVISLVASVTTVGPGAAVADELQEIVVTAQKRAQNLQDVGTSITAFDGTQLAKLGMTDTTEIAKQVPGLQFNQFAPTITIFNIRGVSQNDFSDHQEAPVAVYSDEAYVASMGAIAGSLYDLERVEVLRGPQGTLFGRNATGGLLHFISQKPTDTPDGYVELTVGRFGQINTQGAVNAPLTDRLDARVSFATDYHQGIIHNRIGANGESQRQFSGRLQLLYKINDDANFLLKVDGVRNPHESTNYYSWAAAYPNAQGLGTFLPANQNYWGQVFPTSCAGCDPIGYRNPAGSPWDQANGYTGQFDRKIYHTTGHLDWKLSAATFTSVTDYMQMRKTYSEQSDVEPVSSWNNYTDQAYHQFSQELRLNGKADRLTWLAGLYYFDSFTNNSNYLAADPIYLDAYGLGPTFGALYTLHTRSYAAFTQEEWAFTDRASLILGGRITHDEKTENYTLFMPFPEQPLFTFNPALYPDLADRKWNLPSWKAEFDYKLTPDVMTYASVSRGVKSGGFEAPTVPPAPAPPLLTFNPEKLTSYEVGFKSTFWDGKARLNADVFFYDYKDYQAFDLVNISQTIVNVDAKVKGGELELSILPFEGLQFNLGVSGLDARVLNLTLPDGEVADRRMPQAPKWSFNSLLRYQWRALDSTWAAQLTSKTQTDEYFATFNAPVDHEPGYTVTDARLSYTNSAGNLDVALFCNNIADRRYRVYDLDGSSVGFALQTFGLPRWYGATVTYHWK